MQQVSLRKTSGSRPQPKIAKRRHANPAISVNSRLSATPSVAHPAQARPSSKILIPWRQRAAPRLSSQAGSSNRVSSDPRLQANTKPAPARELGPVDMHKSASGQRLGLVRRDPPLPPILPDPSVDIGWFANSEARKNDTPRTISLLRRKRASSLKMLPLISEEDGGHLSGGEDAQPVVARSRSVSGWPEGEQEGRSSKRLKIDY